MLTVDEMKRRKQQYGYSYAQIAEKSGVPLGTVHKIFAGQTKSPRYDTLRALNAAFEEKSSDASAPVVASEEDRTIYRKYLARQNAPVSGVAEGHASWQAGTSPRKTYNEEEVSSGNADGREDASPEKTHCPEGASPKRKYDRQGTYTLEDYLALPDDQRVELIDGVFYDMSAPYPVHQDICFMLGHYFQNYIEEKGGPCRVLPSPIDVQLDKDDKTVVEPDLCIVCRPELIDGPRIYGAPDLLIEILSKSTRKKDLTLKAAKYMNAGVREYWTVDPEKLKITVFDYEHDGNISIYGFHDKVPVGIYNGDLVIDFEKIDRRIQGMYGVGTE